MLADMIINDLISPQPVSTYDQVTGPNAAYNNPKLSEEQRRVLFESVHGPQDSNKKTDAVNMQSQDLVLSKFIKQNNQLEPIVINNQTGEDGSPDIPLSHITNMGDPGLSLLYPAPR